MTAVGNVYLVCVFLSSVHQLVFYIVIASAICILVVSAAYMSVIAMGYVYTYMYCIFRGVHLKDLISLHTALPDRVDGNLLNFRKMAQLAVILRELTRLQGDDSIPVDANMDLVNTLRVCMCTCYLYATCIILLCVLVLAGSHLP